MKSLMFILTVSLFTACLAFEFSVQNIGNDILRPDGKAHAQERIDGLAVTSYGRCFAFSSWCEMHREGTIYENGAIVGDYTGPKGVRGVLRKGGKRCDGRDGAADSRFAYYYSSGWGTILQFDHNGNYTNKEYAIEGKPLSVEVSSKHVIAVLGTTIKLYDKETTKFVRKWNVSMPGDLAVDMHDNIWVVTNISYDGRSWTTDGSYWTTDPAAPPEIICYNENGNLIAKIPAFSKSWVPTSIAFRTDGTLMVADDGPGAHIIRFIDPDSKQQIDTFGQPGGIGAGTPGRILPDKFIGLTGCGSDSRGNLYVTWQAGGCAGIRAFSADKTLLWKAECWVFSDCPDFDPTKDGKELYSARVHFVWEPSTAKWEAAHFTMDPDQNPRDTRRNNHDQCGVHVRYKEGKRFLFVTGMKNVNGITVYKFNGWIATKSEHLDIDRPDWYVDQNCNIWHVDKLTINKKPAIGLGKNGDLLWGDVEEIAVADNPFNEIGKLHYLDESDEMIIAGGTSANPLVGSAHAGPVVCKYRSWSENPSKAWQITVPFLNDKGLKIYETIRPNSMSAAGEYLFIAYARSDDTEPDGTDSQGTIRVHSLKDGSLIGRFYGQEHISSWIDMLRSGVHAFKRRNGDILVSREANYRCNTPIYTIKADPTKSRHVFELYNSKGLSTKNLHGGVTGIVYSINGRQVTSDAANIFNNNTRHFFVRSTGAGIYLFRKTGDDRHVIRQFAH